MKLIRNHDGLKLPTNVSAALPENTACVAAIHLVLVAIDTHLVAKNKGINLGDVAQGSRSQDAVQPPGESVGVLLENLAWTHGRARKQGSEGALIYHERIMQILKGIGNVGFGPRSVPTKRMLRKNTGKEQSRANGEGTEVGLPSELSFIARM